MISIMKQGDETNYSLSEFIVDAPSDVYIMGNNKEWKLL